MTELEEVKQVIRRAIDFLDVPKSGRSFTIFEDSYTDPNGETRIFNSQKDMTNYILVEVSLDGGNNGHPDWTRYLSDLSKITGVLSAVYKSDNVIVKEIKTDLSDDVFWPIIQVWVRKIDNE